MIKYPVPKTEGIVATLYGGNEFSKLELSQTNQQAYQQLEPSTDYMSYSQLILKKDFFSQLDYSLGYIQLQKFFRANLKADLLQYHFVYTTGSRLFKT